MQIYRLPVSIYIIRIFDLFFLKNLVIEIVTRFDVEIV